MQVRFSIPAFLDSRWLSGVLAGGIFWLWYFHYLSPFVGRPLMAAGDILAHVRFTQSASMALAEGQFPIQFANDSSLWLQPTFLYYTPVFYTIAGGLARLGLNANDAVWLTLALFGLVAQIGLWLMLRELGSTRIMAVAAFGLFVTSPYFVTCLYARSAIAELSFLCLLPAAVHAMLVQARRNDFASWLYFSLSVSLLVLSHKIFTAWLFVGLGLVNLCLCGLDFRRNLRFAAALVAAMILSSPYWFNAWLSAPYLDIAKRTMDGYVQLVGGLHNQAYDGPPNRLGILYSFLTSGGDVFALVPRTHPLSSPHMNLQIGPLLSLACLLAAWLGRGNRRLWVYLAFVAGTIALVCSFWELFPFWRFLPGPMRVIQFPYRLLTFTVLAGSALVVGVIDQLFREKRHVLLAVLGMVAIYQLMRFDWRPGLSSQDSKSIESMDFVHYYWEPASAPAPTGGVVEGNAVGTAVFRKNRVIYTFNQPAAGGWVTLPVVCSRKLSVAIDGKPAALYQRDKGLVVFAPAGAKRVDIERNETISVSAALAVWAGAIVLLYFAIFRRPAEPLGNRPQVMVPAGS